MNPATTQANRDLVRKLRIEAELRGDTKFEVPIACPQGHHTRYVSTLHCVECDIERHMKKYWEKKNGRRDSVQSN